MKKTLKFLGYDIELIDLKEDPERPIINKRAQSGGHLYDQIKTQLAFIIIIACFYFFCW